MAGSARKVWITSWDKVGEPIPGDTLFLSEEAGLDTQITYSLSLFCRYILETQMQ